MGGKPPAGKVDVAVGDVVDADEVEAVDERDGEDEEEAADEDGCVDSPVAANVNRGVVERYGVSTRPASVLPPPSSSAPPPLLLLLLLLLLASCIHPSGLASARHEQHYTLPRTHRRDTQHDTGQG